MDYEYHETGDQDAELTELDIVSRGVDAILALPELVFDPEHRYVMPPVCLAYRRGRCLGGAPTRAGAEELLQRARRWYASRGMEEI